MIKLYDEQLQQKKTIQTKVKQKLYKMKHTLLNTKKKATQKKGTKNWDYMISIGIALILIVLASATSTSWLLWLSLISIGVNSLLLLIQQVSTRGK